MISVYELRVGNRFKATPCGAFPEGGEIALELSHIERFARDGQDITHYLSGIELTKDRLTQMGFVFSFGYQGSIQFAFAILNHFILVRGNDHPPWYVATDHAYTGARGGGQGMVYVHQVQDAYCSLLGQPLPLAP
ncbi:MULTISPECIES: hypothetical protein [unclassified Lysobacter]|uniref:hypothetical protein n=1 Tax=unclassified Lysobacter TaxID=2635362 RepID=UPI0006F60EED|nr:MULTISPECIES: hypothetical protein [unclassified Lysobacter]KQZ55917.1 hypothetical protein ASD53_13805 [Lysobacter sp. Root559]KRC32014.1 hypothetical protein ASE10_15715 [Lysobacter sp. Root76]KRD67478.1 hypothetical protein ASE45_11890 [Lysobacter sp. Root96]